MRKCFRGNLPLLCLAALLSAVSPLRAQVVSDGQTNTLNSVTNIVTGNVTVGTNGSFTLLVLTNNALLTNSLDGVIGLNNGANSNTVRVTGAGTRWLMFRHLIVGSNGSFNQLIVSNSALVGNDTGYLGYTTSSSNNQAIVTGAGSSWSNRNNLNLGFNGDGNRLLISDGALVGNDFGYLGFNSTSTGNEAWVTGTNSYWSNRNDLNVGVNGAGNRLVISNGALVTGNLGYIGLNSASSNNMAVVTGTNSFWSNSSDLIVGNSGSGNRLEIRAGGQAVDSDGALGFNSNSSNNTAVVTGANSLWSNRGNLYVGRSGSGNLLTISNGGTVVTTNGYVGFNTTASNNTAIVTGFGSHWGITSNLFVGYAGSGNLLVITNHGVLMSAFGTSIGALNASSNNTVLVTGTNSYWTDTGYSEIGDSGSWNRLVVSNGAYVALGSVRIGNANTGSNNEIVVTGSGSLLNAYADPSMSVGFAGGGNRLLITNGGKVRATWLWLSYLPDIATNNRIVVDGGTLEVRTSSFIGTLDLRNGTNVLNAGLIDVDNLVMTNNAGFFEFNGGTLITRGGIISNGVDFVVGANGTNPAVWDVRGDASNTVVGTNILMGGNTPFNRLLITNGGRLENFAAYVGWMSTSSSNEAVVAGAGSLWSNRGTLYLGYQGSANRLMITNGGQVQGYNGFIGYTTPSSNNTVVVTGTNSFWSNRNDVSVGYESSGNRVVISNGGWVVGSNCYIGDGFGSMNNEVVVTGAGSLWSNSFVLSVGLSGSGNRLIISNGSHVVSPFGYLGYFPSSSNNEVVVTGTGSSWDNNTILAVALQGSGNRLVISNGGLVASGLGIVGATATSRDNVTLITGAGSLWSNQAYLAVGREGSGNRLLIENGGGMFVGDHASIGNSSTASNNEAVVTGAGSFWSNRGDLYVGSNGAFNRLTISNGGFASNTVGCLGIGSASSNNEAQITGTGSFWNNSSDLIIGSSGSGNRLVISNGGLAGNSNSYVGFNFAASNNTVLVTGAGSRWSNRVDMYLGYGSSGNLLRITNGGTVSVGTNAYVGYGVTGGSNTAFVTGSGSLWSINNSLYVGYRNSGNQLVVSNGGVVTAQDIVHVGSAMAAAVTRRW